MRGILFLLLMIELNVLKVDHTLIVENLWRNWNFLEKSCACHRVMPCLISYIWYDKVSYFVPFLEVCVAIELKEANPKPFQAGVL